MFLSLFLSLFLCFFVSFISSKQYREAFKELRAEKKYDELNNEFVEILEFEVSWAKKQYTKAHQNVKALNESIIEIASKINTLEAELETMKNIFSIDSDNDEDFGIGDAAKPRAESHPKRRKKNKKERSEAETAAELNNFCNENDTSADATVAEVQTCMNDQMEGEGVDGNDK